MRHINYLFKNTRGFSLIEILVSLTIFSGILFALISFINLIVATNLRYLSYTKSFEAANLIISMISNDLRSASTISECGQSIITSCNFRYQQSDLVWELIPNERIPGKFKIQKRIFTSNGSEILFVSSNEVSIVNQDIFKYLEYQKYNSSLKDKVVSVKIQLDSKNFTNNTPRILERTSQVLFENYDQSR